MKKFATGLFISILLTLCYLEIGFISSYKEQLPHTTASDLFLWTSLMIGIFTCIASLINPIFKWPKIVWSKYLPGIILIVLISLLWEPVSAVFNKFPFQLIDATQSDIIPQIRTMLGWLVEGVFPYQPIIDWGYELFPTYLPLTWLPFSIPELLSMDYRIFAILILGMGYFFICQQNQKHLIGLLLSAVFLYLLLKRISEFEDTILGYSIESMIAGFYLLFIASWKSTNKVLLASALVLCLLSRYSLVVWLPVYFIFLWKKQNFTFSFKTGLWTLVGVILIYIIPFWSQDTSIYQRGLNHHAKAAINEWKGQPWQEDPTKPYSLYKGFGKAYKFFEKPDLTLEERLNKLQKVHLSLLIGSVLIFSLILYFLYNYLFAPILFLLGSFKVYLALFYHFVQIPYSYLFLVLLILNIPILINLFQHPVKPAQ